MSITCPACMAKMKCLSTRENQHSVTRRYACLICDRRTTTAEQEITTRLGGQQQALPHPRRSQLLALLDQVVKLV